MPRGGRREGAGRPKGARNKPRTAARGGPELEAAPAHRVVIACDASTQPREFLLGLMRNPDLPLATRRDAAVQALPYCHPKADLGGKKERAELEALEAEGGTGWSGLLAN